LGVVALAWPRLTLTILVVAFATYAIADGIFTLGSIAGDSDRGRTGLTVVEGVLSIGAGVLALFAPATATKLAFLGIGLWALFTGITQLLEASRLRKKEVSSETVLGTSGVLRLLLGVMLLTRPHAGVRALVMLLALYAFLEGVLMLGLSITGKPSPREPLKAQHA
jgi:uncharacterized membrane protein HdeD (DUF308 family)